MHANLGMAAGGYGEAKCSTMGVDGMVHPKWFGSAHVVLKSSKHLSHIINMCFWFYNAEINCLVKKYSLAHINYK